MSERAFAMEFKNSFGSIRFVVIAPDIWTAMSLAEKQVEESQPEYPYRLVGAKEIEGTVLTRVEREN